jgi:hypothetical protein
MTKRKKRKQTAHNIPPCDDQTLDYLQHGGNYFIKYPVPFPEDLAEAAWNAYREIVLKDWASRGETRSCWAEKQFG